MYTVFQYKYIWKKLIFQCSSGTNKTWHFSVKYNGFPEQIISKNRIISRYKIVS